MLLCLEDGCLVLKELGGGGCRGLLLSGCVQKSLFHRPLVFDLDCDDWMYTLIPSISTLVEWMSIRGEEKCKSQRESCNFKRAVIFTGFAGHFARPHFG